VEYDSFVTAAVTYLFGQLTAVSLGENSAVKPSSSLDKGHDSTVCRGVHVTSLTLVRLSRVPFVEHGCTQAMSSTKMVYHGPSS